MEENKKEFESYPIRSIRASDEVWDKFKAKRAKSGLTWNQFLKKVTEDKKI